jgi:hypothetical protein
MKVNVRPTFKSYCNIDEYTKCRLHVDEIVRIRKRAFDILQKTNKLIDYHLEQFEMQYERVVFVPESDPTLVVHLTVDDNGKMQIAFSNNISNENPGILAVGKKRRE